MHRRFRFLYAAEVCAKMVQCGVQCGALLLNGPEHWTFRLECSSSLVRMSNFKTLLFIFISSRKLSRIFLWKLTSFRKMCLTFWMLVFFQGTMTS